MGCSMHRNRGKISTSQKILNTAFECLSTKGYANVSIRDIAEKAGVALGQMTYHFKSKETLFLEVIDMMMHQYLSDIEKELKSAVGEKQKFVALIGFFKGLIKDNPKLLKLFIDFTAQALWVPSFRERLNSLLDGLAEIIEKDLLMHQSRDYRCSGYSSRSISKLILGALLGTSIQIILSSDCDDTLESLNLAESLLN